MILHSAAERIGQPQHKKLPQEEIRIWSALLSSLRYSLPCPVCKKHFSDYFAANPIITCTREFIRNWLFNLHYQVNERTQKPNTITIDKIPEIYSQPFCFTKHFSIVNQEMNKALRLGWSSRDDVKRSQRLYEELKRFYDFF
jgi:hypothetical protein